MGFVSGIIGIFTAITYIVKFLKTFVLKYVTHAVILSLQFAITTSTVLFVVAFYAFTITTFITLYNKAIEIINYFLTSGDTTLAPLYGLLNCIGFLSALNFGVSLFFTSLGSIMIFHLTKFTYHSLAVIKDEIFKLGVLLGQAVD